MIGERYHITIKHEPITGLWLTRLRYNRFWFWPCITHTGRYLTSDAAIDAAFSDFTALLAKQKLQRNERINER